MTVKPAPASVLLLDRPRALPELSYLHGSAMSAQADSGLRGNAERADPHRGPGAAAAPATVCGEAPHQATGEIAGKVGETGPKGQSREPGDLPCMFEANPVGCDGKGEERP